MSTSTPRDTQPRTSTSVPDAPPTSSSSTKADAALSIEVQVFSGIDLDREVDYIHEVPIPADLHDVAGVLQQWRWFRAEHCMWVNFVHEPHADLRQEKLRESVADWYEDWLYRALEELGMPDGIDIPDIGGRIDPEDMERIVLPLTIDRENWGKDSCDLDKQVLDLMNVLSRLDLQLQEKEKQAAQDEERFIDDMNADYLASQLVRVQFVAETTKKWEAKDFVDIQEACDIVCEEMNQRSLYPADVAEMGDRFDNSVSLYVHDVDTMTQNLVAKFARMEVLEYVEIQHFDEARQTWICLYPTRKQPPSAGVASAPFTERGKGTGSPSIPHGWSVQDAKVTARVVQSWLRDHGAQIPLQVAQSLVSDILLQAHNWEQFVATTPQGEKRKVLGFAVEQEGEAQGLCEVPANPLGEQRQYSVEEALRAYGERTAWVARFRGQAGHIVNEGTKVVYTENP